MYTAFFYNLTNEINIKLINLFKKKTKKIIIFNDTMSDNHYGCYSVMTNLRKIISSLGKVDIIFSVPVG